MAPSHSKKNSDGSIPTTAGFTPGGHIVSGYSYLTRSHSLLTPSRRNAPKGLESPRTEKTLPIIPQVASPNLSHSSSTLQHSSSNSSLSESYASSPRMVRSDADMQTVAAMVAQLPPNPKIWTPSQVALYLTHVLGLTPKPIVEDVSAYVRRSRMGGKVFLRLKEKDLEAEGLNLKWRKLMIEAVKKLRRDCLRGRIWGFEGGLQWPRQEDDTLEDSMEIEEPQSKHLPVTAKGTLKRLRDKKAIRSMITSFENASQDGREEEAFVALGASGFRSRDSLHSNDSSDHSVDREAMAPIYGKGFVKERAESFSSLHDVSFKRKEFTKEELEFLFGSMSEQEAEALTNELEQDKELLNAGQEEQRIRNRSSSSDHSSISGESGPFTPPIVERTGFDLTPLNPELVNAIVQEPSSDQPNGVTIASKVIPNIEPLRKDVLIDDEDVTFILAPNQALPRLRPGSANGSRSNPYRSSTYEQEELEALGLHTGEVDDIKWSTARKISRPPSYEEEQLPPPIEMSAANDSIRVKSRGDSSRLARDVLSSVFNDTEAEPAVEHMRNMSAHEASGLSPYKPLSPAMSRKSSQKRYGDGEKSSLAELVEARVEDIRESNKATFGRKGGANSMQLTAMLKSSGIFDGPGAESGNSITEDSKKAEDESEWGVTVSRKASRKGTIARSTAREKDGAAGAAGAASRMADLFAPSSFSPAQLNVSNLKELEKSEGDSSRDHLFVPMTTIAPTADGKGSMRKRSMILVERKQFEALAKRMGVLESQLADLEAASLPPLSDLGSMANRDSVSSSKPSARSLDDIFTVPQVPVHLVADEKDAILAPKEKGEEQSKGWSFPSLFGAFPSYAIGVGAGVGFVLLSEVMGRSRS